MHFLNALFTILPYYYYCDYSFPIICYVLLKVLPVVLYGRETWSLTMREERRLRMFENRVLKRVFEPKKDEVTKE
jgi:hypothetical protein